MNAPNCSGVLTRASTPCARSCFFIGALHDFRNLAVQLGDHVGRRAVRHQDTEPAVGVESREARLRHRGHVGQRRAARRGRHRKAAHLATRDMRHAGRDRQRRHRNVTAQEIGDRGGRTLVRHLHRREVARLLQQLDGKVRERAVPCRP